MAAAIETGTQPHLNGGGVVDVVGAPSRDVKKKDGHAPATPIVETPPSPPATETDTDPESPPPTLSGRRQQQHEPDDSNDQQTHSNDCSPIASPVTSPPYWLNAQHLPWPSSGHARNGSSTSVDSLLPGGIVLQDNENDSDVEDRNAACWAKSVAITDFVVVNGSATNIGAFVVWNIRVETLTGSFMDIRKRYSEFDDFRWRLVRTFPNFEAAVPELPPKSIISKFRPKFLEKRRAGLQYFLKISRPQGLLVLIIHDAKLDRPG